MPRSQSVPRVDQPAIDVRKLRKIYPGGVEAVKSIAFEVAAGEVFGLLGPNGAGKSTTIGMLTTTIVPTSGSARVAGFDVASDPLAARGVSSVVFQDPVVDRTLTGSRNLDIHARLWRTDPAAAGSRIAELADTLGLAELLDRPLRDRNEITILLTTHYLDEAERLCDRIAIIHAGEIVALDTPAALLADLGQELVELRVRGDAATALESLRARGIAGDDAFTVGSTLTVPLHDRTVAQAIAVIHDADVAASSISSRQPTLDDVYLRLTGARLAEAA